MRYRPIHVRRSEWPPGTAGPEPETKQITERSMNMKSMQRGLLAAVLGVCLLLPVAATGSPGEIYERTMSALAACVTCS